MLLICLHISENGFFFGLQWPLSQICWTAEQKRIIEHSLNTREVFKQCFLFANDMKPVTVVAWTPLVTCYSIIRSELTKG